VEEKFMNYRLHVSPSLLAADYGYLADAAIQAEKNGAGSIHVDYMDGHYVPNLSFGIDLIPALKKRVSIPLIAHLMISNAEERIDDFIKVKPHYIVVQEDAVNDLGGILDKIKGAGIKCGIAINPDRKLEVIKKYLQEIDYLLILSVFPGFGGQKFIPETLKKMKEAHELRINQNLGYDIAVDGGVNLSTAPEIVKAGANVLIAGTAIYGAENIGEVIKKFLSLETLQIG